VGRGARRTADRVRARDRVVRPGGGRAGGAGHRVDVSAAMLDYARRQVVRAGLGGQVTFHHAGFLTYDHRGELADLIVSQFAFHHLPDFWKAGRAGAHLLAAQAGRRFILRDVVFSFPPAEYAARIEAWIEGVCSGPGNWSRADLEMHVRDEHSTFGWALEEMFRRAGFRIDRAEYETPTRGFYVCSKPGGVRLNQRVLRGGSARRGAAAGIVKGVERRHVRRAPARYGTARTPSAPPSPTPPPSLHPTHRPILLLPTPPAPTTSIPLPPPPYSPHPPPRPPPPPHLPRRPPPTPPPRPSQPPPPHSQPPPPPPPPTPPPPTHLNPPPRHPTPPPPPAPPPPAPTPSPPATFLHPPPPTHPPSPAARRRAGPRRGRPTALT
jgi:SAM-dependent methyltransferase